MKNVLITTLGCKVNQFESAAFKAGFEEHGLAVISKSENADVVVINTCAVTARAGAQSRQSIRQALRRNPKARIIITGCYAELAAKQLAQEKELQNRQYFIIGNSNKDQLVTAALSDESYNQQIILGTIADARDICRLPVRRFGERSRAYLRIQDGCESFCSYCIVPFTRGPNRSLPVNEVIQQAKIFSEEGHKEIVLTGIHLGYYGKDLYQKPDLVTLLDKLTTATPETSYRISSLEPLEISEQLLSLMRDRKNIQHHLHIPLQSGNDEILVKMNRRYTTSQFREVVDKCYEYLPDAAIGIDILAGFPGESDQQFEGAMSFLQSLNFSYLHVFPYSIRPGTVAAKLPGQVPKEVKDSRVGKLRSLSGLRKNQFYQSQLGSTRSVIVENRRASDGLLRGFTDNYISVRVDGPDRLFNCVVPVRLLFLNENTVHGERVATHEN